MPDAHRSTESCKHDFVCVGGEVMSFLGSIKKLDLGFNYKSATYHFNLNSLFGP